MPTLIIFGVFSLEIFGHLVKASHAAKISRKKLTDPGVRQTQTQEYVF